MPPLLTWNGPAILAKARSGAVAALSEVDLRIEAAAKGELYPGHGKRTGTLQRGIVGEPAEAVKETLVRGRVAVKGIRYARVIERRYRYLAKGYGAVKGQIAEIVRGHIRQELGGGR